MQVPPVPPVIIPGALPQDAVSRTLTNIQAQAATPLLQRAIDPSPRSDRRGRTRDNEDNAKGGGRDRSGRDSGDRSGGDKGGKVNIRV